MKTALELRQGLEAWIIKHSGQARIPILLRLAELLKQTAAEERQATYSYLKQTAEPTP